MVRVVRVVRWLVGALIVGSVLAAAVSRFGVVRTAIGVWLSPLVLLPLLSLWVRRRAARACPRGVAPGRVASHGRTSHARLEDFGSASDAVDPLIAGRQRGR